MTRQGSDEADIAYREWLARLRLPHNLNRKQAFIAGYVAGIKNGE